MASINFYLKEKGAQKETPIHLYIRYSGQRLVYSTGKMIHPKFWSEAKQQAREIKEFAQHKLFNNLLKNIQENASKHLLELENELERPPTTKELKKRLDDVLSTSSQKLPAVTEKLPPTFLEVFEQFIHDSSTWIRLTSSGKIFDKRSIQKYNTTYSVLEGFGKSYHLTFESIDKTFYTKFVNYLNNPVYGKNKEVIKTALKFAQTRLSPPTLAQIACEAALDTPKSYFDEIREAYKNRRNVLIEGLQKIKSVKVTKPKGAFYCIVELPLKNADHFAQWLLESFDIDGETVMVAPATGFYSTPNVGLNQIRIAYVLNEESLKKAINILEQALKIYKD